MLFKVPHEAAQECKEDAKLWHSSLLVLLLVVLLTETCGLDPKSSSMLLKAENAVNWNIKVCLCLAYSLTG